MFAQNTSSDISISHNITTEVFTSCNRSNIEDSFRIGNNIGTDYYMHSICFPLLVMCCLRYNQNVISREKWGWPEYFSSRRENKAHCAYQVVTRRASHCKQSRLKPLSKIIS